MMRKLLRISSVFKYFLVFIGFLLLWSNCQAQLPWQDEVGELINHNLSVAEIGIIVMDANSGKVLYEYNADKAFTPASTMKLFSSVAALAYLGADYRYQTTVSIDPKQLKHHVLNGNLYIQFSGDPTLTNKELKQIVRKIRDYGIETINGKVILDNKRFEQPTHAPGWTYDSLYWSYSAPITSIILNQNHVNLKFIPSKTLGQPVKIVPGKYVRFMGLQHYISTVTYNQALHHCSLVLRINHDNLIHLGGCWPTGVAGWQSFSIQNPALFAENILRYYFAEEGIKLKGNILTGYQPQHLKTIVERKSNKLSYLLVKMLKDSDNIYAESLIKTMGYYHTGRGTFLEGVNTMKMMDGKLADIDFQRTRIDDGSGQSRYDLVMPRQVAKLLYAVYHNRKLKKTIYNALPISGVDGTLHWRMMSQQMRGKVHAKTGSMTGVSALSGYLKTQSGNTVIFSIMMNNFVGKIKRARALQDQICESLYQI